MGAAGPSTTMAHAMPACEGPQKAIGRTTSQASGRPIRQVGVITFQVSTAISPTEISRRHALAGGAGSTPEGSGVPASATSTSRAH